MPVLGTPDLGTISPTSGSYGTGSVLGPSGSGSTDPHREARIGRLRGAQEPD